MAQTEKKARTTEVKAVLFDMDGLMFDTEALNLKGWAVAGRLHGFEITEEYARKYIGIHMATSRELMTAHFGEGFNFDAIRGDRIAWVFDYIEKNGTPVKKGLKELLTFLREKGIKTALGSSSTRDLVTFYLEHARLNHTFDVIVCGDGMRGKPEPDIYLAALEQLKAGPQESLVLEDTCTGVLAAHRAGIRSILVPDLLPPTPEAEKLVLQVVESLQDVISIISTANGY